MVFAHIVGVPIEEAALTLAPVTALLIAGMRTYGRQAHRKLRASAQRGMQRLRI